MKVAVNESNTKEVSGGWTLFNLFNPQKGGINFEKEWGISSGNDVEFDDAESKIIPIFNGSPRLLLFISILFANSISGYPAMVPITNASLRYHFIARPDIRDACNFWKENILVGPGSVVPGISLISIRTVEICQPEVITLSKIKLKMSPSLLEFESDLLEKILIQHSQTFPDSILADENGNLVSPTIVERRLHIGCHNTYSFTHPPAIISLHASFSSLSQQGEELDSYLSFAGNVGLEHFNRAPNISLLLMVEYKVSLTVRPPADGANSTLFSRIFDAKDVALRDDERKDRKSVV